MLYAAIVPQAFSVKYLDIVTFMSLNLFERVEHKIRDFLFMNPRLADGGLYLEYYSKKIMLLTPESRTQVVLPDIKPLPSLINRPTSDGNTKSSAVLRASNESKEDSDDVFLHAFETDALNKWSHECYIRVVFLYLVSLGRKEAVDKIFDVFQKRFKHDFHCTITYFWIQMVNFALEKCLHSQSKKSSSETIKPSELSFATLVISHSELLNQSLYLEYYAVSQIQDPKAATEMVLPSIKTLPSLLGK